MDLLKKKLDSGVKVRKLCVPPSSALATGAG
jgi:hypothetical protein